MARNFFSEQLFMSPTVPEHCKPRIVTMQLCGTARLLTTCSATSGDKFGIMTTLGCQEVYRMVSFQTTHLINVYYHYDRKTSWGRQPVRFFDTCGLVCSSLKRKCCHIDEIFDIGCSEIRHFDNFLYVSSDENFIKTTKFPFQRITTSMRNHLPTDFPIVFYTMANALHHAKTYRQI